MSSPYSLRSATPGTYKQNQILFNSESDLNLFNSYLSRVNQIVAKQQEIQEQSIRRTQESLRQLSK